MSVVGQMMKSKKTEITDKLRQEINKARALGVRKVHRRLLKNARSSGGKSLHRHRGG